MKRLALFISLLCGACTAAANDASVQQAGNAAADKAVVQRAIDSSLVLFKDAFMKGDASMMANVYEDDAVVLAPNLPLARGRQAIIDQNKGMMSQVTLTGAKFTTLDLTVTGDYAIETGTYEMTLKPKTGKAMTDIGKYLSIWHKQSAGGWKMSRDMFSSDKSM